MKGKYIAAIVKSLVYSDKKENSNTLPIKIDKIKGMSGKKFRVFLNSLLKNLDNVNYLEIGVYTGSTSIAALYNNLNNIQNYYLIDNWSQFSGTYEKFYSNFTSIIQNEPKIINENCFDINLVKTNIKNIDVYLYDGDHSYTSHHKALTHFYQSLATTFVYIVDDWSHSEVELGTYAAIKELNLSIDFFWQKKYSKLCEKKNEWWNGVGIFVLSKNILH